MLRSEKVCDGRWGISSDTVVNVRIGRRKTLFMLV